MHWASLKPLQYLKTYNHVGVGGGGGGAPPHLGAVGGWDPPHLSAAGPAPVLTQLIFRAKILGAVLLLITLLS